MADISLYLTNVNVSLGRSMDVVQDFESVELGELGEPPREKPPRRIIHFSSGETMEEFSTDEEEERQDLLPPPAEAGRSQMTWGPFFWFHAWRAATSTISACDYLGERMASLFGITSAKYQYAIDEYYRIKKEREEETEEDRLSEEAERSFDQQQPQEEEEEDEEDEEDEPVAVTHQRDAASAQAEVTYQVENENHHAAPNTITVPAIVTAT
ncbi:protein FAM177A1-like [Cololabis saira]|uniref:protein FAM177A1-like n=1 Tax=Cololabis saira TaxID=129043 RepID=UPI002AD3B4A8|nr:protein FAM177A1-like [Cololabis saira]